MRFFLTFSFKTITFTKVQHFSK